VSRYNKSIAAGLGFSKRVGIETQISSHKQTEVWDRQCNNSVFCKYHQSGHFLKICHERCDSVSARDFVLDGNLFKYSDSRGWRAHDFHITDIPWKEHRLSGTSLLAHKHKLLWPNQAIIIIIKSLGHCACQYKRFILTTVYFCSL
jgi:hypothetical protein